MYNCNFSLISGTPRAFKYIFHILCIKGALHDDRVKHLTVIELSIVS